MKSTIKERIIAYLYTVAKIPYQYFFKNHKPWEITIQSLLEHQTNTLGYQLGHFFKINQFEIQESLEEHDVLHVLANIGTTVKDELYLQFYLLGNGKKSLFLLLVITTGILFYQSEYKNFYKQYKRGQKAHRFYDLDFQKMLSFPVSEIKQTFNIQ